MNHEPGPLMVRELIFAIEYPLSRKVIVQQLFDYVESVIFIIVLAFLKVSVLRTSMRQSRAGASSFLEAVS
jgi:hypothetical protein